MQLFVRNAMSKLPVLLVVICGAGLMAACSQAPILPVSGDELVVVLPGPGNAKPASLVKFGLCQIPYP